MWNSFLDWLKIKKCDINWDKESFNIKFLFKKKKEFHESCETINVCNNQYKSS